MFRKAFLIAAFVLTLSALTGSAGATESIAPLDGVADRFDFGGVEAAVVTDSMSPQRALLGGTLRLEPLLPSGGGTSTSSQFQLTAAVGQPVTDRSNDASITLRSGFWTPTDAIGVDRMFRDSFE